MIRGTVLQRSKAVLGGAVVFTGTRVPAGTLLDYLEAGDRLDDFLDDFPTVTKQQALQLLTVVKAAVLRRAIAA